MTATAPKSKFLLKDLDFEDSRLKTKHSFVLLIMKMYACGQKGKAFPKVQTLMRLTKLARSTLFEVLSDLRKWQYLQMDADGKYQVNLKAHETPTELAEDPKVIHRREKKKSIARTEKSIAWTFSENTIYKEIHPSKKGITTAQNLSTEVLEDGLTPVGGQPPQTNIVELKSKTELARESGTPSFGAQQTHHQNAQRLGIPPKGDNEGWREFMGRIRLAQKPVIQGGIVYV